MIDTVQTSDSNPDDAKARRFRSPGYPAVTLAKAVERASDFYEKALHHPVPISVLASAWDYGIKSSGLFGTVAALKQFGLLSDEGSGEKRRFRLSDRAIRIVRDPDPHSEKRSEAIRQAALTPKIHSELWEKYGIAGVSGSMDVALKGYLTLDRADDGESAYSDKAADELIDEYKSTISFAGVSSSGNLSDDKEKNGDKNNLINPGSGDARKFGGAQVGDLIQREANGALTFEKPLRVRAVQSHEGKDWVFVEESETGIPMNEVLVQEKASTESYSMPPVFPIKEKSDTPPAKGTRREVIALDEGDVILTFPENLSADSYDDLEGYLTLFLKKARRRAGAVAKIDSNKDENPSNSRTPGHRNLDLQT